MSELYQIFKTRKLIFDDAESFVCVPLGSHDLVHGNINVREITFRDGHETFLAKDIVTCLFDKMGPIIKTISYYPTGLVGL